MDTVEGAIAALYQQAAQVIGSTSGQPSSEHTTRAYQTLTAIAHQGDQLCLGLFPIALALLILHENYQAATSEGRFRVAHVLGRAAVVVALLHPWGYGRICGLITFAAGGHGGWIAGDQVLGAVSKSVDGLGRAWSDYAGDDPGITDAVSAFLRILPLIGLWLVLVCCLLLSYVAGALLSVSQAVLLSILLAVGKTCIVTTLVPGVHLGGSWARSLAKVAAWSTVAAVVTGLMVHAMPDLAEMVRAMSYVRMLRTAGQFVVLAVCTFSVPIITEKIFSGAAPAGNAALLAVGQGWRGLQTMGRTVSSSSRSDRRTREETWAGGAGGRGGGSEGVRPHKVAPSRLLEEVAMAGTLAVAPVETALGQVRKLRSAGTESAAVTERPSPRSAAVVTTPVPVAAGERPRSPSSLFNPKPVARAIISSPHPFRDEAPPAAGARAQAPPVERPAELGVATAPPERSRQGTVSEDDVTREDRRPMAGPAAQASHSERPQTVASSLVVERTGRGIERNQAVPQSRPAKESPQARDAAPERRSTEASPHLRTDASPHLRTSAPPPSVAPPPHLREDA